MTQLDALCVCRAPGAVARAEAVIMPAVQMVAAGAAGMQILIHWSLVTGRHPFAPAR